MRVLLLGSDNALFDAQSAARERARAYAEALGELHILSATTLAQRAVHEAQLHIYPVSVSKIFRVPMLVWRARTLIHRYDIELVSAQDPFEYGLAALGAVLGTHVKLHIQLHTDPFGREFVRGSRMNRVRLCLMPLVLRRAARIRVVSARLKEQIERRYAIQVPVTVLPIFVNLARLRAIARFPEKGQLLWVGRFEWEKNPELALDAFARAHALIPALRLTMLGTGRLERTLRRRVGQLGLEQEVAFPGWTDVIPYLAKAELLLVTSRYEGYGLATVEALAAAVPVLSTDVGVAREAGASIASPEDFHAALVDWVQHEAREARLAAYPYASFEEYVAAYAADLKAC